MTNSKVELEKKKYFSGLEAEDDTNLLYGYNGKNIVYDDNIYGDHDDSIYGDDDDNFIYGGCYDVLVGAGPEFDSQE